MMSRDDAKMMNREDVLRELELLPMWQLRAPLKIAEPAAENAQAIAVAAEVTNTPVTSTPVTNIPVVNNLVTNIECIVSQDKKWVFVCPADRMATGLNICDLQSILLKNILFALKVEKTTLMQLEQLATVDAKVIIAMGEIAAQALLNTQESLEVLREKPHLLHNIPLIVTYHPNDCLQHLPNKAKTWDDLCTALSIMKA